MGPNLDEISRLKKELVEKGGFQIEDMGDLNEYLDVKITKLPDRRIKLAQPHLIAQILEDLSFQENTNSASTPANSSTILERDLH
jgi:maleate cis-trans isomerase